MTGRERKRLPPPETEEEPAPGTGDNRYFKLYLLSSVVLALAISLCLAVSVQVMSKGYVSVGGYSVFRVVTGSMEPEIPTGAVLLSKRAEIGEIAVGDVVCYRTRVAEISGSIVTHRVVSVHTDGNGAVYLEARGDANVSSDPYYVDAANLVGRVVWYSGRKSVLTDMLNFLSGKFGFLVCIVFPVLLVAGLILQSAVKNLRRDLALAKYEMERGPIEEPEPQPEAEDLLPGYSMLTHADYEELYDALKKTLLEEQNEDNTQTDAKTE